jgi:pheromone shutdown protein TraB
MNGPARVRRVGHRLVLVGTVHVDPASRSLVRETVYDVNPEAVALELDPERLTALQNPEAVRLNLTGGPSFLAMALLEKFAGQLTGSSPGLEMLEAVKAARQIGAKIELIDIPIRRTVAGLKRLPLGEKIRIGVDGLASLAFLPFARDNFTNFADEIQSQLAVFRHRYPNLSKLLLEDREEFMAGRIRKLLAETTGSVVAILGLGHLASIANSIEGYSDPQGYSSKLTWTLQTG